MLSFIHISDLHIGKRLYGYDLHEDQKYMLNRIIGLVEERKPDIVLIAGDIYDRVIPSEESTALVSDLLQRLQSTGSEIFVIAGNHDPSEKLTYLSDIADKHGLHIVGNFNGKLEKRTVNNTDIYMLPYVRIADVRRYFPEDDIESLDDAVKVILNAADIDKERINVLIAHQFVMGATVSGSEDLMIGGESPLSCSIFSDFDYVALGHIHRAQNIGNANIRYSGSVLKYSVSEKGSKVALSGMISDDGNVDVEEIRLEPLHDVIIRKGSFSQIMANDSTDDYIYIILTDEIDVPDAVSALSSKFPRFLSMEYDNARTNSYLDINWLAAAEEERSPEEYFSELFESMTRKTMSDEQRNTLESVIAEIWGNA